MCERERGVEQGASLETHVNSLENCCSESDGSAEKKEGEEHDCREAEFSMRAAWCAQKNAQGEAKVGILRKTLDKIMSLRRAKRGLELATWWP